MENRQSAYIDGINLILAIILFVSPWIFGLPAGPASVNAMIAGIVIGVVAIAALVSLAQWEEWVNLLLGLWLIVSPWVLGFAHTRAMHFSIGVGATVAFLAALELWLVYDATHPESLASSEPQEKH